MLGDTMKENNMESTGVYAGRMPRGNYFWVNTALGLLSLWLSYEFATIDANWYNKDISRPLMIILMVGVAVAQSIPAVRRFHDIGESGWNYWLLLIPIYNIYLYFVLLCRPGMPGANGFGPQPAIDLYSGRMNRSSFFPVILLLGMANILIMYQTSRVVSGRMGSPYDVPVYIMIAVFIDLVRSVPVVRRFHDLGKPGKHFWLLLIPLYNIVLGLRLLFKRGQSGANQYGVNPLSVDDHITQPGDQARRFAPSPTLKVK